ncbi:PAS domain S-box protein [Fulvivirgaceae bacterium BMA10]|uniref:histidine kinase n=1 Tax=Splendidivirga corallicola TaxID=3051826 RepID=A0ABT8KHK4_9BACT|nr:PAS domain S-box protein [Fulvivirgaceae bacterium BMA10]
MHELATIPEEMTVKNLKILILEDDPTDVELMERQLQKAGFSFDMETVKCQNDFIRALEEFNPDLVLSDYNLPSFTGIEALKTVVEVKPSLPFIIVSGELGDQKAVETLKLGATDYVLKDKLFRLPVVVNRALREAKDREEKERAERDLYESKKRLKLIVKGADIGTWDWDITTGSIVYNKKWLELLGSKMDKKNANIESAKSLIHSDDLPSVEQDLQNHLTNRTPIYENEHRIQIGSGEWRWVLDRGKVTEKDKYGNPLRASGILQDITKRKVIEEEMQKLALVAKKTNNAIIIMDKQGCIEWVNEQFKKISEFSLDEVKGHKLDNLLYGEKTDPEKISNIKKVISSGRSLQQEMINYTKSGRDYWIELNIQPVFNSDNELEKFIASQNVITVRKLAEEELIKSEKMLVETQNIAHLGSFEWIIPENKVIWSEELFRIFGFQPREIPATIASYLEYVHKDDKELVRKKINQSITLKQDYELEHRIVLPDERIRIINVIGKVTLDKKGNPIRLTGLIQDITERKQGEEAAQRFGRILSSALNEIYIFGEEDHRFIEVSHSALQNLGYSIEELRELTPLDLKPEFEPKTFRELVAPLISGEKEAVIFETYHKRKDGSTYPVEVRLQYSRSETPPVFVAVTLDITERKKAQRAKYEGQEMERKRIAMEIHDGIGQMLIAVKQRIINLDAENIDKDVLSGKMIEIEELLSMTIDEARRTSNNLAPVVLKKMGIEPAITQLCKQTEKVGNLSILLDQKGENIEAGERVLLAIYRIAQEALNNIVKHANATQVKVQIFRDTKNATLIIADNGSGFDVAEQMRRAGSGLHNMKERASLVNGEFYVESSIGNGTYIKLDIPLN